jgi:GntR family transcriptional regulator
VVKPLEPTYQVVARQLRTQILQGDYRDGRRLPTEAELAQKYDVSRQTIRRAFHDLVSDGLVHRTPGRGTFVHSASDGYVRQVGSIDDLIGLSEDTVMEVVRPLARRVDLMGAGRLRLSTDMVFQMEFVRIHDDIRFCATTVCLPPEVGKLLMDVPELTTVGTVSTVTVIGLLDRRLRTPIAEAQQSITVEQVSESEAASLHCPSGLATLRIDRLYFDNDGNPVELATSHFLPEYYSYRISLRRNA